MQQDHDPVPRITLCDENRVPQLGFGTLAVQPDRESSDANAG
jgi:2,5-diketo-D-gluconate reductase A